MDDSIYEQEGYAVMGAAFEVYNELGPGLPEEVYQESLEIELRLRGIPFKAKHELAVFYKGRELKKRYVPDLFAFDNLVVEIKALPNLAAEHEAELLTYLHLTLLPVGYLLNFGHSGRLEWKRFILVAEESAAENEEEPGESDELGEESEAGEISEIGRG